MSVNRDKGSRPGSIDPVSQPVRMRDDLPAEDARSATNRTRQGVTGHNVRYVLIFALAGVILAFILIYMSFSGQ